MGIRKRNDSRGFSIIEVMISLAMMSIVMVNILPAFAFQMKMNTQAEVRTGAIEMGQRVIDMLRFISTTSMPSSGAGPAHNVTIDGRAYVATPYFCLRNEYCTSSSARHVTVRVVYNGKQVYETETVFTNFQ